MCERLSDGRTFHCMGVMIAVGAAHCKNWMEFGAVSTSVGGAEAVCLALVSLAPYATSRRRPPDAATACHGRVFRYPSWRIPFVMIARGWDRGESTMDAVLSSRGDDLTWKSFVLPRGQEPHDVNIFDRTTPPRQLQNNNLSRSHKQSMLESVTSLPPQQPAGLHHLFVLSVPIRVQQEHPSSHASLVSSAT
jgi:hypothetical protein